MFTQAIRQLGILATATNRKIERIDTTLLGGRAGNAVHMDDGSFFELFDRDGCTKVVYYRWIGWGHDFGKTVDLFDIMATLGRESCKAGEPYNPQWAKESMGYECGYMQELDPLWTPF